MVRQLIVRNVNIITILFIVLLTTIITPFSYASEQIETVELDYVEIEVVEGINHLDTENEFVYAKSTVTEYKAASIKSRDILRTIPSINTKDNKVLGIVMPPFAFFKTKF